MKRAKHADHTKTVGEFKAVVVNVMSKKRALSQESYKIWTPEGIAERIMFGIPGGIFKGEPSCGCLLARQDAKEIHELLVYEIGKALDFTRQQAIAETSVLHDVSRCRRRRRPR